MNSINEPVKPVLKIDWATHEAAKFACLNWHYSKSIPVGKLVKVGVWENEKFIGVIIFAYGANKNIGKPFGLTQNECCELVRVALTRHETTVSRIMAISIKWLKKQSPGLRLVVSYADTAQGHHGGIYQATNWFYIGSILQSSTAEFDGKIAHKRTFDSAGIKGYKLHPAIPKHKYALPLDDKMCEKIAPLAKSYPKRVKKQDFENPSELGGAFPTDALHSPC
jgi:hypothetical protein